MSTYDESLALSINLPIAPQQRMDEEAFIAWCMKEDVRAEWVDGDVVLMSPNSVEHVAIFRFIMFILGGYVEHFDLGEVMGSELFIRLPEQKRRRLPDILFVSAPRCDLFRKAHFEGGPDMIVEILSPDSEQRDRKQKFREYEAAGVREYWLVDPLTERFDLYVLSEARKYESVAERDGWFFSTAVPGFRLKTEWLWPATRPKALAALRELIGRVV